MKLDRRTLLGGAAALLAPAFPARALAQGEPGPDGFRIIRPRQLRGELPGRMSYTEDETPLVLRIAKGDEFRARLVNGLNGPTTIHWRGVRGPSAMDGTMLAQKPVSAGESFDYRFTPPDAGTFMFHAHAEPSFAAQTQRGLAGVLIVEDPAAQKVDHEIVAALADRPADETETGACARLPDVEIIHTNQQMAGEWRLGSVVT